MADKISLDFSAFRESVLQTLETDTTQPFLEFQFQPHFLWTLEDRRRAVTSHYMADRMAQDNPKCIAA